MVNSQFLASFFWNCSPRNAKQSFDDGVVLSFPGACQGIGRDRASSSIFGSFVSELANPMKELLL